MQDDSDSSEAAPRTLAGDPWQRAWVIGNKPEGTPSPERSALVTLLAGADESLTVLGTAFIVAVSGNRAVCLCAAHSLNHVKQFDEQDHKSSFWYAPPDLVGGEVEYLRTERIVGMVSDGGDPIICQLEQINLVGGNDLALIAIVAPETHEFPFQFAVDLAVPTVGTEVMLLCHQLEIDQLGLGEAKLRLSFHARQGIVTDVEFGSRLPGQSALFFTTIPTHGGMSGSPVIAAAGAGDAIRVLGVLSSDLSPSEAFENYTVAGHSAMSMIWPAVGLGIQAGAEGDSGPRYYSFLELMNAKFVDNRTVSAVVGLFQRRDRTDMAYFDAVHGGTLLRTAGHPDAPE